MMDKLSSMKAKKNWDFSNAMDPEAVRFDFGKVLHLPKRLGAHRKTKSLSTNSNISNLGTQTPKHPQSNYQSANASATISHSKTTANLHLTKQ